MLVFLISSRLFAFQFECPHGCGSHSDPNINQIKRQVFSCFRELQRQSCFYEEEYEKCNLGSIYPGSEIRYNCIYCKGPEYALDASDPFFDSKESHNPKLSFRFKIEMSIPRLYRNKKLSLRREWEGYIYDLSVEDLTQLTKYGLTGDYSPQKGKWEAQVELRRCGSGISANRTSGENYYSYRSYSSMLLFFQDLHKDLQDLRTNSITSRQNSIDSCKTQLTSIELNHPISADYPTKIEDRSCYCRWYSDYSCDYCKYRSLTKRRKTYETERELLEYETLSYLRTFENAEKNVIPLYQKMYDQCIDNHHFLWAFYHRGLLHFHEGNLLDAFDDIQSLFEDYEKTDESDQLPLTAYFDKGVIESELGLYNNAVASLSHVIENDPNNKDAYFERAVAYFETGSFDKAFSDFLQANPQKTTTLTCDFEYAKAMLAGLKRGSFEGAGEFIPSLLGSIKGMSTALWSAAIDETAGLQALVSDPTSYLNLFLNLTQQYATELSMKAKETFSSEAIHKKVDEWGEIVQDFSPDEMVAELDQLAHHLLEKDPDQLGEQIGYVIGKYGVEALAWYGLVKLPKALKFANRALTFELGSESVAAREAIVSQALKKQSMRELISAESCAID